MARVLRPRGNKGEVAIELLTDFPERLTKLQEVFLGRAHTNTASQEFVGPFGGPEPASAAVRSCWLSQNHRGQGVLHFTGVDSINDAERFRGLYVLLRFEQRVKLQTGQYFVADLIGCEVFQGTSEVAEASSTGVQPVVPQSLGIVKDVQFPGESEGMRGTPLLELETLRGELLIPLAEDICKRIDIKARRIEALLPEGLRDLNSE